MNVEWCAVYQELKSWQGAIGALLGFAGLIAAALFNARLNRKRDERLRREEVIAVAAALYGEILIQRTSLARMANAVGQRYFNHGFVGRTDDPFDRHFIEQISMPPVTLYPALAAKVGMLPSDLALGVVKFFSRLEQAQIWLPRLKNDPERPFTYSVGHVLDPAIDAIEGVVPALRQIEKLAGIPPAQDGPDITGARSAKSHEELLHEG